METTNPTFLLISSASAAALMGAVFSYAKTSSERKIKALEIDNEKIEELRKTITSFICSIDMYFEHAAQQFENAEEVDVTDIYSRYSEVEIRYYKKTYSIDKDLFNKLWSSYGELRVRLATFGSNKLLDNEIDKAIKLVRSVKTGETFIRQEVPIMNTENIKGNWFERLLYTLSYPRSGIFSGTDIRLLKIQWEDNCKALIETLNPTFALIENRLEKNSKITDSLEEVSITSIKVFTFILFAELAIYSVFMFKK